MSSAPQSFAPGWRRGPITHRAVALVLAIAIEILLLLALLDIGVLTKHRVVETRPVTFALLPAARPAPKPHIEGKTVAKVERSSGGTAPHAVNPTAVVKPPPMVIMSKDTFAATDIGALPSHNGAGSGTSGKDSGAAYGPGEGPGGAPLYNAEWYVEPSSAELALYLPPGGPQPGWALIVCRTIEHYHVDNCRGLSESPPGSGLARALRLAAWQFLVRPPRIGGKSIVGAWVRIRFDFTQTKEK